MAWPAFERRRKGIAQRIFRSLDVAPLPGQPREQPPVSRAGGNDRRTGTILVLAHRGAVAIGRISVLPIAELGLRSAHTRASSKLGTSMTI